MSSDSLSYILTEPSIRNIIKKTSFMGIGITFRQISQYRLMKRWEQEFGFTSVLEAPYDHATLGVDGVIFSCPAESRKSIEDVPNNSYDMVWNFGFLQRSPSLIFEMKRVAQRYVAAFVPNCSNPGAFIHKLYHFIRRTPCTHPERGYREYMALSGLTYLFESAGLEPIERGYIDIPPWPDTVVTLQELLGASQRRALPIRVNFTDFIWLMQFEDLLKIRKVFAHHCYILARKPKRP